MEKKFFGCYRSPSHDGELKWSQICKDENINTYISKKKNIIHRLINKIFK
ncbi:hypothetical protein ACFHWD_16310 [Clostridium sp. MT-14]|jgi:hypothetical protein